MNREDLRIDLLTVWKKPNYYFGFSPEGDYVIYSKSSDSSIMENSNYELILTDLLAIDKDNTYEFRASHFLCGWVDYVLIKKDSPDKLTEKAIDIVAGLSDYPVYDDSDYYKKQNDAINECWDNLSLSERIELCKKHNISIFAARDNKERSIFNISNDIYYEIGGYI